MTHNVTAHHAMRQYDNATLAIHVTLGINLITIINIVARFTHN